MTFFARGRIDVVVLVTVTPSVEASMPALGQIFAISAIASLVRLLKSLILAEDVTADVEKFAAIMSQVKV